MADQSQFSLFSKQGERKYLNHQERHSFYDSTKSLNQERRLFCLLLYYTGARISEIYNLTERQFDFVDQTVIIRSLKRRRNDLYRQIPLPNNLLRLLQKLIDQKRKTGCFTENDLRFWSFCSRTASRFIKQVMTDAGITGTRTSAMALRHGFAVNALNYVAITQVQKWMGHGYLTTTAIYLNVSGSEERKMAEKMWDERI